MSPTKPLFLTSYEKNAISGRHFATAAARSQKATAASSPRQVQLFEKGRRGHATVGIEHDVSGLIPVDIFVKAHSKPTANPHVGRTEESLRFLVYQGFLHSRGRRTPNPNIAVAVMVFNPIHEDLFAGKERGHAVTEFFRGPRELQTQRPDLIEWQHLLHDLIVVQR